MLVCAAVLNVPVSVAPVLPIVPALTVLAIIVPLEVTAPTAKLVSVPTLVMLVCAAVDNVPANVVNAPVFGVTLPIGPGANR